MEEAKSERERVSRLEFDHAVACKALERVEASLAGLKQQLSAAQ